MLYWSAFSMMRQCMMPPEGECKVPYYVFSREPKWGWGYGGQVFHESLAMLAYVYMDPAGAMNSQRVYMQRQREDGYINYRTGPWLNETIETGGKPTTSAPWYNYVNHEIYQVTKDAGFLKEAYQSGKKFYAYFVSQRDSNANGLCEWGAHAELESVRDARVAVWDKVGWASNFEGPDVNSMLVREAMGLEQMALALGKSEEANEWEQKALERVQKINQKLWDPVSGFYFNINRNDGSFSYKKQDDLKIKEIIGILPLWAGVPDREQAHLLVRNLLDTNQFWRRFGIPSLSAADPYYCPIGYWNGPVWVQWNYLIYRGLKEYGYYYEAKQLSNRVMDNMIFHLKKDHTFWEFYSADDYQAGWNRTYIWAGLAARFILDESWEHP
jgi:glycogen debranching enzyme